MSHEKDYYMGILSGEYSSSYNLNNSLTWLFYLLVAGEFGVVGKIIAD